MSNFLLDFIKQILGLKVEHTFIGSLIDVNVPVTIIDNTTVQISKIGLYAIRKDNGEKVYTINIRKRSSRTFGMEVVLKNKTRKDKNVTIKWCIYKRNSRVGVRTTTKQVDAKSTKTLDIDLEYQTFRELSCGNYRSVLWIDGRKADEEYFRIKRG